MQTRTGARDKLKGFIVENRSNAGKNSKLKNQKTPKKNNKTQLHKNRKGNHGDESYEEDGVEDGGDDGNDLTKTEKKTGD